MKKILVLSLSVLLLSACEKENTFSYLIRHPTLLRQEVVRCQALVTGNEKDPHCTRVMSIAEQFDATMNKEMQSPQELGEYVLQVQSACVAARLELKKSEDAVLVLNAKQASLAEINAAQKTVATNKQAYEAKHEEMQILYAVLGLNSPE